MLNDYILSKISMQWLKLFSFCFACCASSSRSFLWNRFHYQILLLITNIVYCIQMVSLFSSSSIIWHECIQIFQRNTGYYRHLSNTATVKYNGDQNSDLIYLYLFKPKLLYSILYYYYVTCTLQLQFIWYLSIISPKYFHTHWNCKVVLNIIKINVWNKRPQLLIQNIKINMIYNTKTTEIWLY